MKRCIILANGDTPSKKIINQLYSVGVNKLICADGGANIAYKLNLTPDFIIGDFDSIRPEVKKYYFSRSEIIQLKGQNDTDVEKCLKFAIKKKFGEVFLMGATGDRLDHTICNLGIVLKFYDKIRIKIIHKKSILIPCSGNLYLNTVPNELISLYAFDNNTKITSNGLYYPLKNTTLQFGKKESTSNFATSDKVSLNIKGGIVFVIRELNKAKKNGLFLNA